MSASPGSRYVHEQEDPSRHLAASNPKFSFLLLLAASRQRIRRTRVTPCDERSVTVPDLPGDALSRRFTTTRGDAIHSEFGPIAPGDTVDPCVDGQESAFAEATLRSQRSRFDHVLQRCRNDDATTLDTLSGRDLHGYRLASN